MSSTYSVSPATKLAFQQASSFHPNVLSEVVYLEKYSRWSDELGRRETWPETVRRASDFLQELSENKLSPEVYDAIYNAILNMQVLPSMRLLAMAGPAARRSHVTLYNCSYVTVNDIQSFVEALIISMCGTGVGYSVEQKYVQQLPVVFPQRNIQPFHHVVADSAEGWADALKVGLNAWYQGFDVTFDTDGVRPAGAVLKIKGGRASGPKPLRDLLSFARTTILGAQGRKLTSLECHDIMGNIALGAVSGGHRRSAMIALYTWNDQEMRHCKDGEFWNNAPWRTTANNSAVLDDASLDAGDIRSHFRAMVAGGNGEPGIFSRVAARNLRPTRRQDADFGTNPCGEISLRPEEFCNLTEIVLRPEDTEESIIAKTVLATIIGTIQSSATYFPGLRPSWQQNCDEERLLGVGYTGQMDCPAFQNAGTMQLCKSVALEANRKFAAKLGIPVSASITCVKPSGSTSILVDSSSGLHTRWAPYYEKNVRLMAKGPVAKALLMNNFPMDPENGQTWESHDTLVAHFPLRSPEGAVTRKDRTAIQQCDYWKLVKQNLTEHNPSVTITYKPEEVSLVEDWIVENIDILGGMAFLPHFEEDVRLKQMPFVEKTREQYEADVAALPETDLSLVAALELEDQTIASSELACFAGNCEV